MSEKIVQIAPSYDRTTIILHWTTAILVVVLWVIGQTADFIPDGPVNTFVWSFHVVLGFAFVSVLICRIAYRATAGRRLPPADAGVLQILAKATHYFLYVLLAVVVILGVVNAFVRGYNLFDLFSLPQIGDKGLKHAITKWHGWVADVMLALAGLHAGAALVHQFVWRDKVLTRMMPDAANRPA